MHPKIESQITFLYTNNLEVTGEFYEDKMGFPLVLDQGPCRIYEVTQNSYVAFCQKKCKSVDISSVIFTIVTPDVDGWYEHLHMKGVDFEEPPQMNQKFKIYHAFLRDPNGYLIEIQKFDDPSWNC